MRNVVFGIVPLVVSPDANAAGAEVEQHTVLYEVVMRRPIVAAHKLHAPAASVGNGACIKGNVI